MRTSTRVVVDTNVLVSSLLFITSVPAQAFQKAMQNGRLLMSDSLLNEAVRVLSRQKFDRYASKEIRYDFVAALVAVADHVAVTHQIQVCRDPKDNMILELAVNGGADFILTGDEDLLALGSFHKIPIWTPAQYLAR